MKVDNVTLETRYHGAVAGFLRALGLSPSPLEALELRLDAAPGEPR